MCANRRRGASAADSAAHASHPLPLLSLCQTNVTATEGGRGEGGGGEGGRSECEETEKEQPRNEMRVHDLIMVCEDVVGKVAADGDIGVGGSVDVDGPARPLLQDLASSPRSTRLLPPLAHLRCILALPSRDVLPSQPPSLLSLDRPPQILHPAPSP